MTNYTNDIAKLERRAKTAHHELKKEWTPRKAMKRRACYGLLRQLRKLQVESYYSTCNNDQNKLK